MPARTPKPKFSRPDWENVKFRQPNKCPVVFPCVLVPLCHSQHLNQDTERQDSSRNIRILDVKMQIQTSYKVFPEMMAGGVQRGTL